MCTERRGILEAVALWINITVCGRIPHELLFDLKIASQSGLIFFLWVHVLILPAVFDITRSGQWLCVWMPLYQKTLLVFESHLSFFSVKLQTNNVLNVLQRSIFWNRDLDKKTNCILALLVPCAGRRIVLRRHAVVNFQSPAPSFPRDDVMRGRWTATYFFGKFRVGIAADLKLVGDDDVPRKTVSS